MVNVFVIHSGSDYEQAQKIIKEIEINKNANVLLLENGGVLWKVDVNKKIKQSQIVLFVVGKNSSQSKNIDWELKQSIGRNKIIYIYKLDKNNKINGVLFGKDKFSNKQICFGKEISLIDEVSNRITKYENDEYDILNEDINELNANQLIDQYKLYLQTSENLISRRQSVSSFYISVNAALISIATTLIAICNDNKEKLTIIMILAIMGIILDISWLKILEAYGTLNASKMKVISIIEKSLPVNLYDSEWYIMSDKLSNKKYVSFTDSEKRIPIIFAILYIVAIIISIILMFL